MNNRFKINYDFSFLPQMTLFHAGKAAPLLCNQLFMTPT
jgi:hypothetical protein